MIWRVLRPLRRAMSTKSRVFSEKVCARTARAPRPRCEADQHRLGRVAVHVDVRRDDDQDRERRDHENDVRQHVQHVVQPAAAVAGGEPDRGAEQPGDSAADGADEKRRAQPVDELREHILSEGRRPEPVLGRRRRVRRTAERERRVRDERRRDDRSQQEDEHDTCADDELPVPQREVDELGAARGSDGRRRRRRDGRRRDAVGRLRRDIGPSDGHQAPPCMPIRVRGSMKT